MKARLWALAGASLLAVALAGGAAYAQDGGGPATLQPTQSAPWLDKTLPVDVRASSLVDAMTLDEQISLLRPVSGVSLAHLEGGLPPGFPAYLTAPMPPGALGSAGFAAAVPRLGWPALQESDAGLGVANSGGVTRPGDEATALPSSLALAASFDPELARASGAVIGEEAHAKGFNVQLAGAVNLSRDPRNGRNFEYAGEDPLLAGRIVGASIAGVQSRHVVSTVKHFALNDQETGRMVLDARIGEAALRESDLLAFQIAIETGRPGAVMCAYNQVNDDYACQSPFLLTRVLKGEWRYPGWVMSDWGAAHSLEASVLAGLDQQSPQAGDTDWFAGLHTAVEKGAIPRAKVRDMAYRVVRSVIAVGAFDDPARPGGAIDRAAHAEVAQSSAEAGMVLLKNDRLLPLSGSVKRIVLIGGHADKWVLTGGGSSQVAPYGGLQHEGDARGLAAMIQPGYIPSSPMAALRTMRPDLQISFDDGTDPARAAAAAAAADVAIVFAEKVQSEGADAADLRLPDRQDALITKVAASNPRTAVVLETGNPIEMPWLSSVAAVLEAWFPGQRGGEAIANILTGAVAPSGRLPITFPTGLDQLPRPALDGAGATISQVKSPPFAVDYSEGSDVGYRWFHKTQRRPLFPFGYGLTYTTFRYGRLALKGGPTVTARFTVTNAGRRAGSETAQLYLRAGPGRDQLRLLGWAKVRLQPGETREVTVTADRRLLASWDPQRQDWRIATGIYQVFAGPDSLDPALQGAVSLKAQPLTR